MSETSVTSSLGTLHTVPSLAEYLSVSRSFVYKLAESHKIGSLKVGKQLRFTDEHVTAYLESCSSDQGTARARAPRSGRTRRLPQI
ncbi:helix-turn-helix domain-containing protein [Acinetobacter baumannii]|nr:helix-turn-helix domain-containing protein [Acinetobacter baumannii]